MNLKRLRILLWALVGLAAMVGVVIALGPRTSDQDSLAGSQPLVDIGGPFTLTGADGKPFSSTRLAGKPHALFFGFTHCPDVCPTTLARLARLRQRIGKGDDSFAIVLVSVDPERDTPAEMARYASLFGTPVISLTGSRPAIEGVKRQYGVYSAKAPRPDGGYSVDHTATVFLIDGEGKFAATISTDEGDAAARAKLERLLS